MKISLVGGHGEAFKFSTRLCPHFLEFSGIYALLNVSSYCSSAKSFLKKQMFAFIHPSKLQFEKNLRGAKVGS